MKDFLEITISLIAGIAAGAVLCRLYFNQAISEAKAIMDAAEARARKVQAEIVEDIKSKRELHT